MKFVAPFSRHEPAASSVREHSECGKQPSPTDSGTQPVLSVCSGGSEIAGREHSGGGDAGEEEDEAGRSVMILPRRAKFEPLLEECERKIRAVLASVENIPALIKSHGNSYHENEQYKQIIHLRNERDFRMSMLKLISMTLNDEEHKIYGDVDIALLLEHYFTCFEAHIAPFIKRMQLLEENLEQTELCISEVLVNRQRS